MTRILEFHLAFPRESPGTSPVGFAEHRDDTLAATHGLVADNSVIIEPLNLGENIILGNDAVKGGFGGVMDEDTMGEPAEKSEVYRLRRSSSHAFLQQATDMYLSFSVHTEYVRGHVRTRDRGHLRVGELIDQWPCNRGNFSGPTAKALKGTDPLKNRWILRSCMAGLQAAADSRRRVAPRPSYIWSKHYFGAVRPVWRTFDALP